MVSRKIIAKSEEIIRLKLNQFLLNQFGMNITIEDIEKLDNRHRVNLSYSKIFSIVDEASKIIYLRTLYFHNIYSFDYRTNFKFNINRRELNDNIHAEFSKLRNEISVQVLNNKSLILQLINVPSCIHFLGKFLYLTTNLVNQDKIEVTKIKELIKKNKKYEKYINLLVHMNFATYNEFKDLIATNKIKAILDDKKNQKLDNFIKDTVDEILYLIIKENLDYLANILNLKIIKSLINVVSCIHFFKKYLKIEEIKEISLDRFYTIYESLIERTSKERIDRLLNILTYSGMIKLQPSEMNLRLVQFL